MNSVTHSHIQCKSAWLVYMDKMFQKLYNGPIYLVSVLICSFIANLKIEIFLFQIPILLLNTSSLHACEFNIFEYSIFTCLWINIFEYFIFTYLGISIFEYFIFTCQWISIFAYFIFTYLWISIFEYFIFTCQWISIFEYFIFTCLWISIWIPNFMMIYGE